MPLYHLTKYKVKESSREQEQNCGGYGDVKTPMVNIFSIYSSVTLSSLLGRVSKALNRHDGGVGWLL